MIYISHRMDEIQAITDRITILRDGEYVKTLVTKDTNLDEIIQAMVGRVILYRAENWIEYSRFRPGRSRSSRTDLPRRA